MDVMDESSAEVMPASILITLLVGDGQRSTLVIDGQYLEQHREVIEANLDPSGITVLQLKGCILHDWKEDWGEKPNSAVSIRLIHFGHLLDDKTTLTESKVQGPAPSVIHMSVRPNEIMSTDDSAAQAAQKGGRQSEDTTGCRCLVC